MTEEQEDVKQEMITCFIDWIRYVAVPSLIGFIILAFIV